MPDYKVTVDGADPLMIRAANQAQARNFAVRKKVKVEPLDTKDAIEMAKGGQELLDATAEESGEPEPQVQGDGSGQEPEKVEE